MTETPTREIHTSEVLASESFRLLNALIDEAATEVRVYDAMIQDTCRRITGLDIEDPDHTRELRTRTYEECQAGAENPRTLDLGTQMKNLVEIREAREEHLMRIASLQRAKLRLLNDYDFTRGDDSFQRAVLAPETVAST